MSLAATAGKTNPTERPKSTGVADRRSSPTRSTSSTPAAAARLGVHRALHYREETGTSTKFRPYGPPTGEWLHGVRTHLTSRRPLQPATDLGSFHVT